MKNEKSKNKELDALIKKYPGELKYLEKSEIKSDFILRELKKRSYSNAEDRAYIKNLLNLQEYLLTGNDTRTWDGKNIPYFTPDKHPSMYARQHPKEYKMILTDIKGKEFAEAEIERIKRLESERKEKTEKEKSYRKDVNAAKDNAEQLFWLSYGGNP